MLARILFSVSALAMCFFCIPALFADENKDDAKLVQGNWKVVALEADGKQAPDEALKGMRWSFKGNELQGTDPGEKPSDKASFKLDSSKSPKQIDLVVLEGAQKGKTIEGIYKFEKVRLIVCLRGPEAAEKGRPQEFKTEADSGLGMITLERIKE